MKNLLLLTLLLLSACKDNDPAPFSYELSGTSWSLSEADLPDGRTLYKVMSFNDTHVHVFYSFDKTTVHMEVGLIEYNREADKYYTIEMGETRVGQIYPDRLTLDNETFIRI